MIEFRGQQMTAKQYLKKYVKLESLIESMENQLYSLRSKSMKCTSTISPNSGGNGPNDRVGNIVVKIAALEDVLKEKKNTYLDMKADIIKAINSMPDYDERLLLSLRYCEGMPFRKIAWKMSYSERALFYVHGKALRSFEKVCSKLQ